MCEACWIAAGRPQIDTPAVRAAVIQIARAYGVNDVGGDLHFILDDWNVDDHHLARDVEALIDENPFGLPPFAQDIERACLTALRALTLEERYSALARHDGLWGSDAVPLGESPETGRTMLRLVEETAPGTRPQDHERGRRDA